MVRAKVISEKTITSAMVFQIMLQASVSLILVALGICTTRESVETGLGEKRTGIVCLGARSAFSGNKCWEEKQPEAARALRQLAESHAQQDPTLHSVIAYTRLTAAEALKQLGAQGFGDERLPAPSTMALVLSRMGYRLRKVVKAKPQKNSRNRRHF
jgi:hypothetical protein